MSETAALIIIGIGILFDLFGTIGLTRFPDFYTRIQAATKCVTLGTCLILLGVFVHQGLDPAGIKAVLCMVFILVTSPTAAHALARGAYRGGIKPAEGYRADAYAEALKKEAERKVEDSKAKGFRRGR